MALVSTDADASDGPILEMFRNSSSPADDDDLGLIKFFGENDASEKIEYGVIEVKAVDVSDGTEDGSINITAILNGTARSRLFSNSTETVFNEGSQDLDFRVESDGNTHMLFVDAGNNAAVFGSSTANDSSSVTLRQDGTAHVNNAQFSNGNGSAGGTTPSIYSPASATLAISTNSSERLRVDGSGNVGIGGNPVEKLHVNSASGDARIGLNAPTGSDTEIKFFNNGTVEYTIGHDDGTDNFVIGSSNVDTALLSVTKAGNLGIGTTTPQAPLAIRVGTSGTAASTVAPALDAGIYLEDNASPTGNFIVVKSHNPGNGTAVGGVRFACSPDGTNYNFAAIQGHTSTAGKVGSLRFFTPVGNTSAATSTERMRLQDDDLIVGDTGVIRANSQTGVSIESEGRIYMSRGTGTGAFAHLAFYNGNGLVGTEKTSGSATSYNTSSDERLKENIVDAPSASTDVDAIKVRSFDWKSDGSHQKYGMIAQELKTVAPEAVSAPEDPDEILGVDYSKLVPMLVKEIQSLRSRVAELENN